MADPPIFDPGSVPTAGQLQALGSEPSIYTPGLVAATADPDLGSTGIAEGVWVQTGPLVHVWFSFQFGGSGIDAGTGQYRVILPVPVDPGALVDVALGSGRAIDASVGTDLGSNILGVEMLAGVTDRCILATEEAVTVAATVPWTWATGDRLFGHASYIGAF